MGIEARHSYRFGYLKSEHWQNLRLSKMAQADACCFFCNKRDLSNDVHHVFYPESLYETKEEDLRVLCRTHHERLHELMEEIKKDLNKKSDNKKGQGFKVFRIAAEKIEKEMIKQGLRRFTRKGVRLHPYPKIILMRENRSFAKYLSNFKNIRAIIRDMSASVGWSQVPDHIRQKTAFVEASISIIISSVDHLSLVQDEIAKSELLESFKKEIIDDVKKSSVDCDAEQEKS